ncbi:hypothetical protein G6O67_008679 [Ophiocordyceps sinensis]|uniref:DDHD domain-containing protein n=1 Tax=Ophiocordyceps sinensis TaxID=72228 RepID=A0A8H4LQR1_9HYPO|nr:hypothetical protein G6O67_008679 [Ophiocordyceps sinensis]
MSLDSRKMPPDPDDKKPEKSYLTSAVESINPWASSRTSTPTPDNKRNEPRPPPAPSAASRDHSTTPLYGQSFRTYPKDCPPLTVQWFHAVDVPKRKPRLVKTALPPQKDVKPPARPKKFTAFSPSDSRRLEARYQKLLEAAEDSHASPSRDSGARSAQPGHPDAPKSSRGPTTRHTSSAAKTGIRVPVNEDFLFHVDIEERELIPVYWLGPVYEARRGTWFFQEGSTLRPCEENLAAQLEEGYLKTKPWLLPVPPKTQADSKEAAEGAAEAADSSKPISEPASNALAPQLQPYRLFGAYMSNVATYQDACTAWLSTDGVLSWVTTSVYERFAGGGYMSGVKLVRGHTEPNKTKDKEDPSAQDPASLDERDERTRKRKSAPPASRDSSEEPRQRRRSASNHVQNRQTKLERELSSLIEGAGKSTAETEEQIRKRDELEIQDDYNAQAGETQGREIEHLVLVTHGIGQRLGLRMENVNFVHDVNVLRKTLKSVYTGSADLKALNSELDAGPGNCRVQVLPVCWRHLIEFPKQRQRKSEGDLGDVDGEEDGYPSLEDITVEGVAFARSLISDLALDVLLYQSSYRDEISKIVVAESNRILRLFREQNPEFKGKVHLMGHSLGSAIYFDVLCRQRAQSPLRLGPRQGRQGLKTKNNELQFDFPVHHYFCLGSPVGLFQMLKGRTIAARPLSDSQPAENPLHPREAQDPFRAVRASSTGHHVSATTGLSPLISSPKVEQLFNIFHPSDPVSYRLEPLISPAMAALKPQQLPYTKKGIFGNVAPQGLTGIGARVGQSVSGLWSSLSAGIASNLLNRSLGLTSEEVTQMAADEAARRRQPGAEGPRTEHVEAEGRTNERQQQLADSAAKGRQQSATLIDDELETLFSTFQRSRTSAAGEGDSARANEESRRARKLRAEEIKVRALNHNGRVDYSIQESALDFNPINTIASHMGYWADEDVNHFVLSQLLSDRERAHGKDMEGGG